MIDYLQNKSNNQSLHKLLRTSLAKGGDMSDIDKIFEHVMNESKRVNESLKQVADSEGSETKKSFLKFYETASKGGIEEMKDFIELETTNKLMKSETYYCTKHGRIKGILTIADTYLMFDPLYCDENEKYDQDLLPTKFQA